MMVFTFFVFDRRCSFLANLVQKIKIVSLRINLIPRLIRTCRIQWWRSLFLFRSEIIFGGKFGPANQTLRWNLIPTISHINCWDQVNSWKNLWKFWNGPRCRNKSSPFPYSMLQDIRRVATPKLVPRNCPRYLQTTLIMGGGGLVSEFMWGIV